MFKTNQKLLFVIILGIVVIMGMLSFDLISRDETQEGSDNKNSLIYNTDFELESVNDYSLYNAESKEQMISFLENSFSRQSLPASEYDTNLSRLEQESISNKLFEEIEKNTSEVIYFPKDLVESINILQIYKKGDNYALLISVDFKLNSASQSYQKISFIKEGGRFVFQEGFLLYGGV